MTNLKMEIITKFTDKNRIMELKCLLKNPHKLKAYQVKRENKEGVINYVLVNKQKSSKIKTNQVYNYDR